MTEDYGVGPRIRQIALEMGLEVEFIGGSNKSFKISCPEWLDDASAEARKKDFHRFVAQVFDDQTRQNGRW